MVEFHQTFLEGTVHRTPEARMTLPGLRASPFLLPADFVQAPFDALGQGVAELEKRCCIISQLEHRPSMDGPPAETVTRSGNVGWGRLGGVAAVQIHH
jgi:hypothetical protein